MTLRKETYEVDYVLSKVELHHTKKDLMYFDGDAIKMGSDRYKTFKYKGVKCVSCDLTGKFFAKERSSGSKIISWHLNLYAIDENGKEVLMTKDHRLPKSKGGKDELENYDPMCTICNGKKGNAIKM